MSVQLAGGILALYFGLLLAISYFTSRGADTHAFFTANRESPWWLVAFGMIGTSISGLTFISVPGAVGKTYFTYYHKISTFAWYLILLLDIELVNKFFNLFC